MNGFSLKVLLLPLFLTLFISILHLLGYFYYPAEIQKLSLIYYTARSLIFIYAAITVIKFPGMSLWQAALPTAVFLFLDQVVITSLGVMYLVPHLLQIPPPLWTYVVSKLSLIYIEVLPVSLGLSLFAAYTYRKKMTKGNIGAIS